MRSQNPEQRFMWKEQHFNFEIDSNQQCQLQLQIFEFSIGIYDTIVCIGDVISRHQSQKI
jgi:hypothetical protein